MLFQEVLERIAADIRGLHQPLRAAVRVGDDDDGARALRALHSFSA